MKDATVWTNRLRDHRSRRVMFVAHCILNENTRYLGGASRGGAIREILQPCLEKDIGIVQLPCPEQHAWGGVLKQRLLQIYNSKGSLRYRSRSILLPLVLWYTRHVYRKLARETAHQIHDYQNSGVIVLGIVGVDASPSCGVYKTLNLRKAIERVALLDQDTANAEVMNHIVRDTVTPGQGIYIKLLRQELARRSLSVPIIAHDIIDELDGKSSSANVQELIENG